MTPRPLFSVALPAVLVLLTACQYTPAYQINKPANGAMIACNDPMNTNCDVSLDIQWKGVQVNPHPDLTLNGTVLPTTTLTSTTTGHELGTIKVPTGADTLLVEGDLGGNNTVAHYSATSTFTVTAFVPPPAATGGFSLGAPSTDLLVVRGSCAPVTITVSRTAPFTGAVALSLSSPPAGITAAGVSATGASGSLSICASAAAAVGKVTVSVAGAGTGVPMSGTPVKLLVGRVLGAFAEASPAPYSSNPPSSATSSTGGFRANVAATPGAAQPFSATFFRGATQVGSVIAFTKGPVSTLGGAGFCANGSALALTRGVVLSGQLPGTSSQNTFTVLDLTAANPVQMTQTADMQATVGGQPYAFQPQIYFSIDCTLAIVIGANKIGPSHNIVRVYNLVNGQAISTEIPSETNIMTALVRNNGQKQEVEVKVDTGTPTAGTTPVPIP